MTYIVKIFPFLPKLLSFLRLKILNDPASTTYETNKGPKWVLIWAPVSFCKRFSDGTNMVYQ